MLALFLIVIPTVTLVIVWAIVLLNRRLDRRADAWRRNHAHKRRWYE